MVSEMESQGWHTSGLANFFYPFAVFFHTRLSLHFRGQNTNACILHGVMSRTLKTFLKENIFFIYFFAAKEILFAVRFE